MSEPTYLLSAPAAADLHDIHEWIAQDDPAAATSVLRDLREAMRRLAQMPGLGHARDDLADETLRVWTVHSYLVIYRPDTHRYRSSASCPATATSSPSSNNRPTSHHPSHGNTGRAFDSSPGSPTQRGRCSTWTEHRERARRFCARPVQRHRSATASRSRTEVP